MKPILLFVFALCMFLNITTGCVKGPLWRSGYVSPWARQRWAEEEQLAASLFSKRDDMQAIVATAVKGTDADRRQAALQLAHIAQTDPVLLVRIDAIQLLGELDAPEARSALMAAAQDSQSDVRMAAVNACSKNTNPESIQILQQIIGGDSDIDVRLAAARVLKNYRGPEAIQALALAVEDPNPALQLRGADSLQAVTDKDFGHDVVAWRDYVRQNTRQSPTVTPIPKTDSPTDKPTLMR